MPRWAKLSAWFARCYDHEEINHLPKEYPFA